MTETFKERINSGEALYGTMLSMFDTPEMAVSYTHLALP